jgi:hypothetical protein
MWFGRCLRSPAALAAPLLLKARQTSALSGETCTALQSCLALLSKQEEVPYAVTYWLCSLVTHIVDHYIVQ